jgi:hypothetical protein
MKDIVIGDHEFVGDWLPFYSEVADVIWGFRTNWKIFYERLNSICEEVNASGLFVDEVVFEKRIGGFALYEMLMRDYDEGQRRFFQQAIKNVFDIKEPIPKWFPFVKPLERPIAEIFRLDYYQPYFSFEGWAWGTHSNEKEFDHFFNAWPLNRDCRRIVTTWLYLISPTYYIGIDDWMADFLMNGREFWVEHHPESLSVEYPDVIIGLPRADRYKEWLHYMEESVGNSRFDGAYYELSYAAYRYAVEKSKQKES